MGIKCAIFIDDLPRMLPIKFWFIWQSGFREEDSLEINQPFAKWAKNLYWWELRIHNTVEKGLMLMAFQGFFKDRSKS